MRSRLFAAVVLCLAVPRPASAATFTVTNTADSGPGSMRQAFTDANATAGLDTVRFDIGGGGPQTILVGAGGLPMLTDPVVVDGTTQPGYAGTPLIELDGTAATGSTAGIDLKTSNSVVRGFILHSFPDEGLEIDGIDGAPLGDNNTLANNWVGIDAAGNPRPNADNGILVTEDADNNTIGGSGPFDANIVGSNTSAGILIRVNSDGNVVAGNFIGVLADGVTARGNGRHGVEIHTTSTGNRIGGAGAAEANTIAFNALDGVGILATAGSPNSIQGNRIFGNSGIAIDLDDDGVTPNDPGDPDAGANDRLNFPVIYHASVLGAGVVVSGEAPAGATVEVFEAAADPGGHGEAAAFVGRATVTGATPGTVDPTAVQFVFTFAPGPILPGDAVTATATSATGATSEFGANVVVGRYAVTTTSDVADGTTASLTELVANPGADGEISLREAILATNNTAGADSIPFRIAEPLVGGVHRISPASPLPNITGLVYLDGTSEPDFAGTPVIELDGSGAGAGSVGLRFGAGSNNSVLRGLVVNRFGTGVRVDVPGCAIRGNRIGTDATGTVNRGNPSIGVLVNTSNTAVGGLAAAEGNVVAFNGVGVVLLATAGANNSILGNSIHGNVGAGIDLGADGLTVNDPADADAGPNGLLNHPVPAGASVSGGLVVYEFDLDVPAGSYRIDVYRNPSGADGSGYGEGESPATSFVVAHPGGGTRRFLRTFPGAAGDVLTATTSVCTDGAACTTFGSTSEFGPAVTATALPMSIVKRAFLPGGTPLATGAALPRGTDLEFLLYVNSPGGAVGDLSLSDALDPAFVYIGGSLRYDASTPSCAAGGCSPAEEAAVYAAVSVGSPGTETVDGDVVSVAGSMVRAGDQSAPNARLDVPAGRVWAMRFRVRIQ